MTAAKNLRTDLVVGGGLTAAVGGDPFDPENIATGIVGSLGGTAIEAGLNKVVAQHAMKGIAKANGKKVG